MLVIVIVLMLFLLPPVSDRCDDDHQLARDGEYRPELRRGRYFRVISADGQRLDDLEQSDGEFRPQWWRGDLLQWHDHDPDQHDRLA